MNKSWRVGYWKLGLVSFVAMGGAIIATSSNCVLAQVIPDPTLGAESSVVTPTNNNGLPSEQIDGGATRGANLFHSFEQFSIPTGGEAFFNNAANIQNIISRVTGGSISNIDGLLRANGAANVFLLNPNGISFGSNASLSIGGSFVGSTASSLNFADGTQFSATAPPTTPLLTISVPIGLRYGSNAGSIQVQGNGQGIRSTTELIDTTFGLRVEPNQTLALVGGNVALSGGTLKTAGGRIELGSVAGAGLVNLTPTTTGWVLGYEGVTTFGDIQLSGQATVDASGLGGGDIQVQGSRVTLTDGSQIEASTLGAEPGGTLSVTASDAIEVIGTSANGQFGSGLYAQAQSDGDAGDLTIATGRLLVRDGAVVSTSTFGTGVGGTLSVTASDAIEVIGRSADGQLGSALSAQARGDGDAGDLTIATGRLLVRDGAQIVAGTLGNAAGGTLSVTASDAIELIGTSANGQFGSGLYTSTEGGGDAGDLTIATGRLLVRDGAVVSSLTRGTGTAGTLSVTASDAIELIGTSANGRFGSGLYAQAQSEGDAGDLTIATGGLLVRDGAQVSTSTFDTGVGGTLSVTASDAIEVIGRSADGRFGSGLFTQTSGEGDAGDLTIATGRLLVRDRALVSVGSRRSGNAGNLEVTADSIRLDNLGQLTARTTLGGQGGNITLQTQDFLLLRRNSSISTTAGTAQTGGSGGNITINTPFIVAVPNENSDITANAFSGSGGVIDIRVQSVFGIETRSRQELQTLLGTDNPTELDPSRLPSNDITAIPQTTPELSGFVTLSVLDVDPSQGLVNLPAVPLDTEVVQACQPGGSQQQSEFIITGRGGLPPNPGSALNTDAVMVDLVTLDGERESARVGAGGAGGVGGVGEVGEVGEEKLVPSSPESSSPPESLPTPQSTIVEATGWVKDANGKVVLVANAATGTPHSSWQRTADCQKR